MDTERRNIVAEMLKRPAPTNDEDDGVTYPMTVECKTLPDGRDVEDLSADELASALADLEIPGARKSNSKEASIALYRQHLANLFAEGGRLNVTMFRLEHGKDDQASDDDSEEK